MFCPNCGKEIPNASKFCGFCGQGITDNIPEQPTYPTDQPAYTPEQPVYPTEQPSYAPEQPVYPTEQPAYTPEPQDYNYSARPVTRAPKTKKRGKVVALVISIIAIVLIAAALCILVFFPETFGIKKSEDPIEKAEKAIAGSWSCTIDDTKAYLIFEADKTGMYIICDAECELYASKHPLTWKIDPDKLDMTINVGDRKNTYNIEYDITDDVLTLKGDLVEGIGDTVKFTKCARPEILSASDEYSSDTSDTETAEVTTEEPKITVEPYRCYVCKNPSFSAEYYPCLELYDNGAFIFTENLNEGMGKIYGTYTETENEIKLSASRNEIPDYFAGFDIKELSLRKSGSSLVIDRNICATTAGASFVLDNNYKPSDAFIIEEEPITFDPANEAPAVIESGTVHATVYAYGRKNLNLRRAPLLNTDNVIAKIPEGVSVTVLGYNSDRTWAYISYNGTEGWACAVRTFDDGTVEYYLNYN